MAIDYTVWPTPTQVFNLLTSSGIVPTLTVGDDLAQLRIDAAVKTLSQKTGRRFLPVTESKNFDGSGSGLLTVDEFIYGSITSITLYTLPAYSTINVIGYCEVIRDEFPCTQIQILQGPANVLYGWFSNWPQGRSNIEIAATWGYGTTIPEDVWEAVLYKAAADIFDADKANVRGVHNSIKDDDVTINYGSALPSIITNWRAEWTRVLIDYKRPLRNFLRRNEVPLI